MQSTAKRKQRDAKHWPDTYSYLFQILFALHSDVYGGYTNNLRTDTGEGIAQIRGDDSFKFVYYLLAGLWEKCFLTISYKNIFW